jgi:hypothetical protein
VPADLLEPLPAPRARPVKRPRRPPLFWVLLLLVVVMLVIAAYVYVYGPLK